MNAHIELRKRADCNDTLKYKLVKKETKKATIDKNAAISRSFKKNILQSSYVETQNFASLRSIFNVKITVTFSERNSALRHDVHQSSAAMFSPRLLLISMQTKMDTV